MKSTAINRRQSLALVGGALALPPAAWAQAGWKPTQNINYVIGVAAGGSVDLYARGIKTALETLKLVNGQTVVADNKPGAAGLLALQQLQRAPGNAHVLGTFHTGSIAGQVTGILKADMREYVPVAMLVEETTLVRGAGRFTAQDRQRPGRCAQARPHVAEDRRRSAARAQHPPGHGQAAAGGRGGCGQTHHCAVPLVR
jgi:tripartite-type tricarboxylate transporter receptor subunit TctC